MFSRSKTRHPLTAVLAAGVAFALASGIAAVISVTNAAPASAHTALVRITPKADAALTTAPTNVVLEFNQAVSKTFATVVVTTAAGVTVTSGKPAVLGARVTQPLRPDLASGDYRIAYRIVSADGHPVSGASRFKLTVTSATRPSTSVATPTASAGGPRTESTPSVPGAAAASARDPKPSQGWLSRFLIPIAGVVGMLFIGGSVLRWDRQRR